MDFIFKHATRTKFKYVKLYHMIMIEFIVTFTTLDFFDISEVIPLFVLRKRAIF